MTSDRRCGTCRWRCGDSGSVSNVADWGRSTLTVVECRRMPPSAADQSQENWKGKWPRVSESDGPCGEWEAREEPDLVTGTLSSVTARSLTAQARKLQDST